jgi:hypothetical protein
VNFASYTFALAHAYGYLALPLVMWVFAPRKVQFMGWYMASLMLALIAEPITYDCGQAAPCQFVYSAQSATLSFVFLWVLVSLVLYVYDLLGVEKLTTTDIDITDDGKDIPEFL